MSNNCKSDSEGIDEELAQIYGAVSAVVEDLALIWSATRLINMNPEDDRPHIVAAREFIERKFEEANV